MTEASDQLTSNVNINKTRTNDTPTHVVDSPIKPGTPNAGRHESTGVAVGKADLLEGLLFSPWRLVFGLESGAGGGHSSSDDSQAEGGGRSKTSSPVHRAFVKTRGSKSSSVSPRVRCI